MLVVLPVVAAGVAATFAGQLAQQWVRRRRPHALAWALSLGLFAVASASVAAGVASGWSAWLFGAYWLAGALLNVPLLAVGQLHLLDPRRAVLWWTLGGLAAAWAIVFTITAPFDAAVLAAASRADAIPLGREVLEGSTAYALVRPMNMTFVVVVVGSVWSAVRTRRWAVLLIALGVTVSAGGSSAVGSGRDGLFSVLLAVGVTTMYLGFRAAGRPPRARRAGEADDAPGPSAPHAATVT